MRTRTLGAISLCLFGAACVHAPPARPLAGGETFTLESVELQVPAEAGWFVRQSAAQGRHQVELRRVSPSGAVVAQADLKERDWASPDWPPETFLAWARLTKPFEGDPATFTPALDEGVVLDERFGALSVRGTFQVAPRSGATIPAGELFLRAFVPAPGGRIVIASSRVAQEPGAPAPAKAEPVLAGLRLRDPSAPGAAPASVPDFEGRGWGLISAGGGAALFEGRWVPGGVVKGAILGEAFFPRAREGFGYGLAYGLFMGGDAEGSLFTQAFDYSVHAVRGPLRYGVGLDVGLVTWSPGEEDEKNFFAIGPRAFAGVDLFRTRTGTVLALEAEAAATTPGVVQGSLSAVIRFDASALTPPR